MMIIEDERERMDIGCAPCLQGLGATPPVMDLYLQLMRVDPNLVKPGPAPPEERWYEKINWDLVLKFWDKVAGIIGAYITRDQAAQYAAMQRQQMSFWSSPIFIILILVVAYLLFKRK